MYCPQCRVEYRDAVSYTHLEADGRKFNRGTFVIANADRSQIEAAARDLGIGAFATDAKLSVARHALEAPRVALLHDWTDTQQDGWFRITMDQLKIPYTYLADTKVRETPNLRDQFDVIIVPPFVRDLSSAMQGLPMQGSAMPWKGTVETPSFGAAGLDASDDIRGGLGYSGAVSYTHLDVYKRQALYCDIGSKICPNKLR